MNNFRRLSVIAILLPVIFTGMSFLTANHGNEKTGTAKSVAITIKGTSTLHDWEMQSTEGKCEVVFAIAPNSRLTSISAVNFILPTKSLKSGHGMMDNNTYKALKTEQFNNITFVLSSANITAVDPMNYELKCKGKLTIAGVTKETDITAAGKLNAADNTITISGEKKFKMSEYNVKPPTVMMGTIKTGDDISITFSVKLPR